MRKLAVLFLLVLLMVAVANSKVLAQLTKPTAINGANTVNNLVNNAFTLYDNTNQVKGKIKALQQEIAGKSLTSLDANKINSQLQTFSNFLNQMAGNASRLISLGADVPAKTKAELGNNFILLSGALINVSTSMKALREGEKNIQELLKTTIPDIRAALKQQSTATAQSSTVKDVQTTSVTQTNLASSSTGTSNFTIDNISFADLQVFADSLRTIKPVTALTKSFSNGTANVLVSHYGTTEQLLDAIMYATYGKKLEVLELNASRVKLRMRQK